jgi:hypothetical protein
MFQAFTALTMKNALFWDVTQCGSCKNRHFGEMYSFHHQGGKNLQDMNNFTVTSN